MILWARLKPESQKSGSSPNILIADDQADVLVALRLLFKGEGIRSTAVNAPRQVIEILNQQEFDVVLIDLNYTRDTTSGDEGLDLLTRIQQFDDTIPVIVMTAWSSIELAVEAMRRGAKDFVQKPWNNERLVATIRTQIELRRALRQGVRLAAENQLLRNSGATAMIAESAAMRPVVEMIGRVAPSPSAVLITGENGCGKGVAARAIHELSDRAAKPLITVNMGGFPRAFLRANSSVMSKVPLPMPRLIGSVVSNSRMGERFSLMRLPT
jgi:DNA-binding NtrC family response regulator